MRRTNVPSHPQAEREQLVREAERKRKGLVKQLEDNDAVIKRKAEQVKAEQEEDRMLMDAVRCCLHGAPRLLRTVVLWTPAGAGRSVRWRVVVCGAHVCCLARA